MISTFSCNSSEPAPLEEGYVTLKQMQLPLSAPHYIYLYGVLIGPIEALNCEYENSRHVYIKCCNALKLVVAVLLLFSPLKETRSIEKPGHRLLWYKVDWHLRSTFGGCFLLATETKFLHTNTVSQDYPCTPGNISQLEPYAVCLCA